MVLVHSATKGFAAMTLALAHFRGWLNYDKTVCTYWPEFAQRGKETITVRQLLGHQAALFAFGEPVDREVVADFDRLALVQARQSPAWQPGTRQAYHAISLGFYEGELLRRIDPLHRSLGQFFQDEIASPLGLDFYIRLPEEIPNSRLATIESPTAEHWQLFTLAQTFTGRSSRTPAPQYREMRSAFIRATLKYPPAGVSALRDQWRGPTAFSPPAVGS
jgi:CubicO group peptidase (beta-lactamase class C family)